jgi:hypothetical protein
VTIFFAIDPQTDEVMKTVIGGSTPFFFFDGSVDGVKREIVHETERHSADMAVYWIGMDDCESHEFRDRLCEGAFFIKQFGNFMGYLKPEKEAA